MPKTQKNCFRSARQNGTPKPLLKVGTLYTKDHVYNDMASRKRHTRKQKKNTTVQRSGEDEKSTKQNLNFQSLKKKLPVLYMCLFAQKVCVCVLSMKLNNKKKYTWPENGHRHTLGPTYCPHAQKRGMVHSVNNVSEHTCLLHVAP